MISGTPQLLPHSTHKHRRLAVPECRGRKMSTEEGKGERRKRTIMPGWKEGRNRRKKGGIEGYNPPFQPPSKYLPRPAESTVPDSGGYGTAIRSTLKMGTEQKVCETLQSSVTMWNKGVRTRQGC